MKYNIYIYIYIYTHTKSYNKSSINIKFQKITINFYTLKSNTFLYLRINISLNKKSK